MSEATLERRGSAAAASTNSALLVAFGGTLFLSAILLFSIQPLFARMVLPRLGGTPAVWSVAMVFFQATLLAGYAYAHLLVRHAGLRTALLIHAGVMAAALLWLPIAIAAGFEVAPATHLPVWLIWLFGASVGFPFFVVAANAPLLQAWFARSGHPHADEPYFLYGASNLGSFVALLSYPILLEPAFSLAVQGQLWTAGYIALMPGVLGCGLAAYAQARRMPVARFDAPVAPAVRIMWRTRLQWIGWAFVPSALLVATTAHLSTNIAAAPFLWVTPLALFLLTFVLTFQRRRIVPHRAMLILLAPSAAAALTTVFDPTIFGVFGAIAVNLFALFVIAMVWHGELVARRPAAASLTEFYLSMSAGGVLGGAFASLAAPVLFDTVAEFPLLLVASVLALPEARSLARRPLAVAAAGVAVAFLGFATFMSPVEYRDRSFFGVTAVKDTDDGRFRLLFHGTTIHGAERLSDLGDGQAAGRRPEPLTYYTEEGPLARAVAVQRSRTRDPLSVAIVGLGAGSMACHSRPAETWRFYEIDLAVVRVATNPHLFSFLSQCAPDAPIVLGDARLTLAAEPDRSFDLLVIDAFSSDAVPVHLLTREALRSFAAKLRPNGVIALHISNRFVELASVVAATAAAEGLAVQIAQQFRTPEEKSELRAASQVALVARSRDDLAAFGQAGFEMPAASSMETAPWTDDYSDVMSAILRLQGLL